jgi:hypothetical protein
MDIKIKELSFDEETKQVAVLVTEYLFFFIKLPPRIVFAKYQVFKQAFGDQKAIVIDKWYWKDDKREVSNEPIVKRLNQFANAWATQKGMI